MLGTERTTAIGVFTDRILAERAINDLRHAGFTDEQIGYIVRDGEKTEKDIPTTESDVETGAAAASGAVSGGVLGGVLGAAASLLIPGIGPIFAGGILLATFGGVALGAVAGTLIATFVNMGVPEEEAHYYQSEFEAGRIILTVTSPEHQKEAQEILRHAGGYDSTTRPGNYDHMLELEGYDSFTQPIVPDRDLLL